MRPTNFATVGLIGLMGCVESAQPDSTEATLVLEPAKLSVVIVDGKPVAQAYRATLIDADGARDVTAETTFVLAPAGQAFGAWSASTLAITGDTVGPTRIIAAHGTREAQGDLTVYARNYRFDDAPANAPALFEGAITNECAPTVSYPADGVVMPPNLGELDVQWAGAKYDMFEVSVATTYVETRIYTRATSTKLPGADWNRLAGQHESIALQVSGLLQQAPAARCPAPTQRIHVTDQPLTGAVYLANANGVQRADAAYPLLASDSIFSAGLWDAMFAPISGGNATSCLGCSLSRDGRRLAIASDNTGALYDFATGALTAPDSQSWSHATFTANGEKLITSRCGDLHVITRDGSQLASIAHETGYLAFDAQVSPDGRTLVNVEAMSNEAPTTLEGSGAPSTVNPEQTPNLPTYGSTIVVRHFNDGANEMGSTTELMPLVPGMMAYYPTWSPDGRYVVFTLANVDGAATPRASLWIVRADGSEQPIMLTAPSDYLHVRARFVPHAMSVFGERVYMIAFESRQAFGEHPAGRLQLWAMPFYADRTGETASLCNPFSIAPCTGSLRTPAPAIRLTMQSFELDNRMLGWL